jgi:hypothetical protein
VFLKDVCAPEGQGIVDTAGMTDSIVHDNKGIRESDELVEGQMVIVKKKRNTHLAVQQVGLVLVKLCITMKARLLEQRKLCSINHKMPHCYDPRLHCTIFSFFLPPSLSPLHLLRLLRLPPSIR